MHASSSSALDVAAPSAAIDRWAPWLGPVPAVERGLFWVSFHGLSTFAHVLVLALVAVPFLVPQCRDVDVVPRPPVTVQMAIVEVKPPPPPPERPPPPPPVVESPADSKPPRGKRSPKARQIDELEMQMLAVLGSSSGGALSNVLSTGGDIDNALGALVGDATGVEGGVVGGVMSGGTGLGLVGTDRPEGARGEGLGLGSIGTAGGSRRAVTVSLDGAPPAVVRGLERMLASCRPREPVRGTIVVAGGRVVDVTLSPTDSCMDTRLRRTLGLDDGTWPLAVEPR